MPSRRLHLAFTRTGIFVSLALAASALAENKIDRVDFNFQIRPLLSDRCFKCHGPDEKSRKAKLRLDTSEDAYKVVDKETGVQIIAPGKTEKSEVIRRITTDDADDHMPPAESNLSLSTNEI